MIRKAFELDSRTQHCYSASIKIIEKRRANMKNHLQSVAEWEDISSTKFYVI